MEINKDLSRIMHRISGKLHSWVTAKRNQILIAEVTRILDSRGGHHPFDDETLFEELQQRHGDRFGDGILRTLQRRVRAWPWG